MRSILAFAAMLALAAGSVAAQTITEYPLRKVVGWGEPNGITTSIDGNLWATEYNSNLIVKITLDGSMTSYPAGVDPNSKPFAIVTGPDGNLWFAETGVGKIGKITPQGVVTEYPTGIPPSRILDIAPGPDGNLWFTTNSEMKIGKITTDGAVTLYPTNNWTIRIITGPDGNLWVSGSGIISRVTTAGAITDYPRQNFAGSDPEGMAVGGDGNVWFADRLNGKVGKITLNGDVTLYSSGITPGGLIEGITRGPDGIIWFTESKSHITDATPINKIGRISNQGIVTEYSDGFNNPSFVHGKPNPYSEGNPLDGAMPLAITLGSDGNLWFTEGADRIAQLKVLSGSSPLVAALLPGARSVQVGAPATVYATILNNGPSHLSRCGVSVTPGQLPGLSVFFQTTDPSTNGLTGFTGDVDIEPFSAKTFALFVRTNSPVTVSGMPLLFSCLDVPPVETIIGVNTIDLTFSTTPSPDIVALALTASGDGIVNVPLSQNQSGAFAVASVNVGAGGPITVSADTGSASLPLAVTVCQTDPATAQCLMAPEASQLMTFAANATPTFSVFIKASQAVAFSPGTSRIFLRFKDEAGIAHGSTSVAVRTN